MSNGIGDTMDAIAARMADEILIGRQLAAGWTPVQILREHYTRATRTAKTAAVGREYREARDCLAGATTDFFKEIAEATKSSLLSVTKMFMDSRVVKFFKLVGWSFKSLFGLLKRGHKAYVELQKALAEKMAESRVGKWTEEKLRELNDWLQRHPVAKRIGGVAIGALLIYWWFNQSFIGDPAFDFDMTYILDALRGSFNLADLFAGPSGMHLLLAVAVGMTTGASFPWPGPGTVKFIAAIIGTLAVKLGKKLKKAADVTERVARAVYNNTARSRTRRCRTTSQLESLFSPAEPG